MKIKRFSEKPDPMKFVIPEIGEDENGKYAIVRAKNEETGEVIEKKMYENKTYDSEKDFSEGGEAENIGAALGASGLAAGVGYLGSKAAEKLDRTSEDIADKLRWKRSIGKKGELVLEEKSKKNLERADRVEKIGQAVSKFAKKKGGKAAIIATPALIAGGTTYIVGKKKRKRKDD